MRFHPVLITGDLQQAFLQVRIKKEERDALRFHWKISEDSEVEVLRFTRALFGLVPSPFLLGGVIECHLETWETRMPELVAELRRSLYVDDLISGKPTAEEARQLKQGAIEVFADAKFKLHKWHSYVAELEGSERGVEDGDTFAKQQLSWVNQEQRTVAYLGSHGTNKGIRSVSLYLKMMKSRPKERCCEIWRRSMIPSVLWRL